MQFQPDGAVTVRADCNRGVGSYTADAPQIDIIRIATTRAACPPESLADRWLRDLEAVVSFVFRDGNLYLALPADAGILELAARAVEEVPATPAAG
jgi:para-nitrobenzyl esterase